MSTAGSPRSRSRLFWSGIALQSLLLIAVCAAAASRTSFAEDDFRWLAAVRSPDFSWLQTFFPLEERDWWAWRPLGMHAYFRLVDALFGWRPPAFYAVSMLFHFGGGLLVHRLARQLGFAPEVAAATALLACSRAPSLELLQWASAFNYFSVAFFSLLCVVLFLDWRERGGWPRRAGSALALGAALLCQESALLLPAVLIGLDLARLRRPAALSRGVAAASLLAALRACAPQLVLTAVWAVHRFLLIAPHPRRFNYESVWGASALHNARDYLVMVVGGELTLTAALGGALLLLLALSRDASGRARLAGWLAPTALALAFWCVAALLPFVSVRLGAVRFAIALEVPLSLLFGALLAARLVEPLSGAARLALLVLPLLALPWGTLAGSLQSPRGSGARAVLAQLEADARKLEPGSRLVLLYGKAPAGERALMRDAWWLHRETWSGTMLWRARLPDRQLTMAFRRLGDDVAAADLAPGCRYYAIDPSLQIRPASSALRAAFFEAALGSSRPAIAALAARRLEALTGRPAAARPAAPQRSRSLPGAE